MAILVFIAALLTACTADAVEIVDHEGGYRVEVPRGWEGERAGDRVVLTDPNGMLKDGSLAKGGGRMYVRPIADPEFWFAQLGNREETLDMRRVGKGDGVARLEYLDRLATRPLDHRVSIACPRVGDRWICVVLEYRVDEPQPALLRGVQAGVVESLAPVGETKRAESKPTAHR